MMAHRDDMNSALGLSTLMLAAANVRYPAGGGAVTFQANDQLKEGTYWPLDAANWWVGSEFKAAQSGSVTAVNLLGIRKNGSVNCDVIIQIWSSTAAATGSRKPNALLGAAPAFAATSLSATFAPKTVTLSSPVAVTQNTIYWVLAKTANIGTIGGSAYVAIAVQENDTNTNTAAGYTDDALTNFYGDGDFYDEFYMTVTGTA